LCYGDYGHQHFKQPESLALQVRVLNAVIAAARRPVSFVSFTVPQYQREDSYFAPFRHARRRAPMGFYCVRGPSAPKANAS
jgi:hypothetical protein